jgi:hypothetical protein
MTFFYDLNKKLDEIRATPSTTHGQLNERDMGKHNNATTGFAALAKKAGGGKKGEKIAGAQFQKMKKAGQLEEEGMTRAAKGYEKYGKEGMEALAKAGREGKALDPVRNKYDKYDESMGDVAKKVGGMAKKVGGAVLNKLGHGDDADMMRDLQRKMGVPKQQQHGKPSMASPNEGVDKAAFAKLTFADKIAGAKKEVDERLGDVAAEAIKSALSGGQKKLDKNKNGSLDANDFAMMRKGGKKKEVADEGWDDMVKDVHARAVKPKVGSIERGHKHDIEHTATGRKVTRRVDDQGHSVGSDDASDAQAVKRGRGRPAGTKSAIGAKGPSGRSKLMTRENDIDPGEDRGSDLKAAMALLKKAGYKISKDSDNAVGEEKTTKRDNHAEKAGRKVTKDIEYDEKKKDDIHGKKRGSEDAKAEQAGKKVAKDIEYDEKKNSKEDKPKKVKEEGGSGTPTASSGFSYGKGIYDSLNRDLETMIAESMARLDESMSINMSDSTEGGKSLTITASDEDALKLGMLLKNAGLGGSDQMGQEMNHGEEHGEESCPSCGMSDCGCDVQEAMDEAYGDTDETLNKPNWPTDTETSADALQYSGGLDGPKSTGQSTVPVLASQEERQHTYEADLQRMRDIAGIKEAKKPDANKDGIPDYAQDGKGSKDLGKAKDKEKKVEESIFALTNSWKAYKG